VDVWTARGSVQQYIFSEPSSPKQSLIHSVVSTEYNFYLGYMLWIKPYQSNGLVPFYRLDVDNLF